MSASNGVDPASATPASGQQNSALRRLAELKRALQRQVRRKLTAYEQTALDHCALMQLRSEIALRDPASHSDDIVRLANVSRRALSDFLRVCGVSDVRKRKQATMRDVERELASHAR